MHFLRTGRSGAPLDLNLARQYYEAAADCGHREAQHNLGAMYWSGDGAPVDAVRAVSWFKIAAEKGNASSQLMLGLAHLHGVGFKKQGSDSDSASPLQAIKYLKLAAESGDDTRAMYHLGLVYMNGVTSVADDKSEATFAVDVNLKLAIKYLNRAARRKHADAKAQLELALERKDEQEDTRIYDQNRKNGKIAPSAATHEQHVTASADRSKGQDLQRRRPERSHQPSPLDEKQKCTLRGKTLPVKAQPQEQTHEQKEARAHFAQQLTLPQLERLVISTGT